jgi:outer membrane receptor protein involved in Fe transport
MKPSVATGLFRFFVLLLPLSCHLHAEYQVADNRQIGQAIAQDIRTFLNAAEQTKENIDYQPFIVSVYHGKELEKVGITTLEEALMLTPGIDIFNDNFNFKSVSFRGSNPLAFGQSKLFIDNILVNELLVDGYTPYLQMPIEMIKRIEVTRGPGSQSEGINAYAGSIHVFTYAEAVKGLTKESRGFLRGGSSDFIGGGAVLHTQAGSTHIDIDLYYREDDRSRYAGWDALSQGTLGDYNRQFSQNGDAPLALRNYALGVSIFGGGWALKGRLLRYDQDAAYGSNYVLPPDEDSLKLPRAYLELSRSDTYAGCWESELKLGYTYDGFDLYNRSLPPGFAFPALSDPTTIVVYPEGFYSDLETRQQQWYHSTTLRYKGLEGHRISTGYRFGWDKTTYQHTRSTNRDTGTGMVDYSDTYPFIDENASRDSLVLFIEDLYDLGEDASLQVGLNYENNSQIDPSFNPRAALVWRYDADKILKLLYSHSIRTPSWQELYIRNNRTRIGNKNLEAEKVHAFEVEHVWDIAARHHLKTNVFFLDNRDQIGRDPETRQFQNRNDSTITGLELEYRGHISASDSIYANYTWQHARVNDESAPYVADHLAKGYYLYKFDASWSAAATALYVSQKEREPTDPREALDAYFKADLTLNYADSDLGLDITANLANVFDARIKSPSEPYTYSEDYLLDGRRFMLSIRKAF